MHLRDSESRFYLEEATVHGDSASHGEDHEGRELEHPAFLGEIADAAHGREGMDGRRAISRGQMTVHDTSRGIEMRAISPRVKRRCRSIQARRQKGCAVPCFLDFPSMDACYRREKVAIIRDLQAGFLHCVPCNDCSFERLFPGTALLEVLMLRNYLSSTLCVHKTVLFVGKGNQRNLEGKHKEKLTYHYATFLISFSRSPPYNVFWSSSITLAVGFCWSIVFWCLILEPTRLSGIGVSSSW